MLLAVLIVSLAAAAHAQPAGQGVVSGVVVDAATGDAVRKAVVTLTWQGTPRSWATTRTDGSGRFKFEALPSGKYDLRAIKTGIGTAVYGGNSTRELGEFVILADGETRDGLTLRFIHSGSVAGKVLDADGDPVVAANVSLMRAGRNLGDRILVNYRNAATNDRGDYQIRNVDPGQYYLVTNSMQTIPGRQGQAYARQFYGGARESKDASPMNIRGGESLTGFDFHVPAEPLVRLRGQITGIPADAIETAQRPVAGGLGIARPLAAGRVSIMLTLFDDGEPRWRQGTATQAPDHRFEMGGLQAGRYRLEASVQGKDRMYSASQVVDVGQGSEEVILNLTPALDVKGHLRLEGQGAPALTSFNVALTRQGIGMQNSSTRVGADGSFTLSGVPPGELELAVNPLPRGGFLKSAMLGDADIRFTRLEIAQHKDAELNIVVSMNSAKVEGEIDAAGADSTRAGILLAPFGALHNFARFFYNVVADANGKFKLEGIAPGKYKIFALEKMAAVNFRTPEAAEQLDSLGTEIDLVEGATTQVRPKLIPMERAREALQ